MRLGLLLSLAVLTACASSASSTSQSTRQTVQVSDGSSGAVGSLLNVNTHTDANNTTVQYSLDKVWAALPVAFDSLAIPVTDFDAKAYTIGNTGFKVRRRLGRTQLTRYLECGQTQIGPNAESYEITLAVMTKVMPGAGTTATNLSTTVEATGRPLAYAGATVRCTSKGTLEEALMNILKWQLERGT